jgi:DNA-binding LacI/PurR family transcriptional regulator
MIVQIHLARLIDTYGGDDAEHDHSGAADHALCVPIDAFSTSAMQAAVDLGRAIPRDLKIATRYDGLRARESRPQLTAVNLHLADIAAMAVNLLLDQLNRIPGPRHRSGPESSGY